MDFMNGGLAGAGATLFTNPMDVIKTRLQLQGELRSRAEQPSLYRGFLHAAYVIMKTEGVMGLQRGLVPAMWLGFSLNSVRLGLYNIGEAQGWTKNEHGEITVLHAMPWASACGFLAGFSCNPASVIKTRIQANAHPSIAVGKQHGYKGFLDAIARVYRHEGLTGFYSGITATCLRIGAGSAAQLSTFSSAKQSLVQRDIFTKSPQLQSFAASSISGIAVAVMMAPLDIITVRLYNQGRPSKGQQQMYSGVLDCTVKIYRTEGIFGFYKGFWPLYLRLAPHTTFSLVIWDMLNSILINHEKYLLAFIY